MRGRHDRLTLDRQPTRTKAARSPTVTIWSGLGEWIAEHVAKGDKVVVAGRLRWREYEVEGTSRQAVDITADSVVPVPRSTSSEPAPQPAKAAKNAPAKTKAAA
ncbi:MAG: single-stranded DNA-binding protein [Actinobacteria bacterium]|nr:single-stranded DNA-binding protein [Actinomycetota bacterium]